MKKKATHIHSLFQNEDEEEKEEEEKKLVWI